jgi:hypothetical protein
MILLWLLGARGFHEPCFRVTTRKKGAARKPKRRSDSTNNFLFCIVSISCIYNASPLYLLHPQALHLCAKGNEPECYFLVFRFAKLFSLLTLCLLTCGVGKLVLEAVILRTRSRSFTRGFNPFFASVILAFFLANLLATRSGSEDLNCLRASLER